MRNLKSGNPVYPTNPEKGKLRYSENRSKVNKITTLCSTHSPCYMRSFLYTLFRFSFPIMTLVTPYYFLLFPLRENSRPRKNFVNLWVFPILFPSFPIIFPIIFPLYPHNFTVSYSFLINSYKKKREEKRGNTRKLS